MTISVRQHSRDRLSCIVAAAIAICIAAPATGGTHDQIIKAGGQAIVIPTGTPLQHWRALSQEGMSGAEFTGKVSLTGTLYYYGASPDTNEPGAVLFEPDRMSAARLPYMKEDGKPPQSFGLKLKPSGDAAAFPMALRKAADASKGKKVLAGPASLSITGYSLFQDGCGASEYRFEGETIDHAGPMQLGPPPQGDNREGGDC